jgi:D-methionine transport system permease protein
MIFQDPAQALWLLFSETGNTLYMVFASTLISIIIGMPIGIILVITDKGGIKEKVRLNSILGMIVNIGRSFPFAILIVALIPFTRLIVGTSLGTTATIVPLSIAAAPFVARVIESSLKEVDKGIVEAAISMGSSTWEIIIKVLIPEAMASIVLGVTLTIVNLIGYSAMAGMVGGGGLGNVAIQYGYYRYDFSLIIATVILLVILVQILQWIGNSIAKVMNKK